MINMLTATAWVDNVRLDDVTVTGADGLAAYVCEICDCFLGDYPPRLPEALRALGPRIPLGDGDPSWWSWTWTGHRLMLFVACQSARATLPGQPLTVAAV